MRKTTAYRVEDDAHWHDLRKTHLGGSEVAALFNAHAQLTHFELWHNKRGNLPEADFSDNDRVFWGNVLEPAIAAGVSQRKGWDIRKVRRYLSDGNGLGGSLDYEIINNKRGPGVLEIKMADWLIFKDWENDEPPLAYLIQLQTYLALTGRSWGAVAVLVGGNDIKIFEYDARPAIIGAIRNRVADFWASITDGREPKPNFEQDADTIGKLFRDGSGPEVDLTGDNYLVELCENHMKASAEKLIAEKRCKAIRAEILTKIGNASVAWVGKIKISASETKGYPAYPITPEMVGQSWPGRAGFRTMRITQTGEKNE